MASRVIAIIQARMESTRLPGKVLLDIKGKTMLSRVIERIQSSKLIDEVIVATTMCKADEAILSQCRESGVKYFRGSNEDVLDRYYHAAKSYYGNIIVRVSSDCPLIDSSIIDRMISAFLEDNQDYISNTINRTYPRGLDAEVLSISALEKTWKEANKRYQRVHVTPYIYENIDKFRIRQIINDKDYNELRWTVDTIEDLDLVRRIFYKFGKRDFFTWLEVLKLIEDNPILRELNANIKQKPLHEC